MMTPLFVTNFNRNFTGVSATAANVIRQQMQNRPLELVGHPLPDCPAPISLKQARNASRNAGLFAIWHVRRNTEMRAALWARDVLKLPVRIVFTSAAQRRHSAFPRWLISRMDAVIATTPRAARFIPDTRAIVPHGIDTTRFFPASNRAAAWRETGFGGKRGIASIGRIRPEKGTDLFVQSMLHLLPRQPDLTALVIGRATGKHHAYLQELKSTVAQAGLSHRLLFLDEHPAERIALWMRSLSLIMQLPRYEGFGMVPLEGMASAVPFVATDTGAYRSFSDEGRAGLIVSSAQEASAAAFEILQNKHEAMARHALHLARTRHSAEQEAKGIEAVYESLKG